MGSRLGRRVIHFANLPIKLLMPPVTPAPIREFALKTIPSATKFEIRSVLESLYGFDVEEVRTLNMEGRKKKRGGLLLARPDYKKAYVTLRAPLPPLSPTIFPIKQIEEERQRTKQLQQRHGKTTVVEKDGEGRRHWMEKEDGEEDEVGRDRWDRERRGGRGKFAAERRSGGGDFSGRGPRSEEKRKFPWSSMRIPGSK